PPGCSRCRSSPRPESTGTMFSPSSASTDSTAIRCAGASSTIRMSTRSHAAGFEAPPTPSKVLIGSARRIVSPLANQPRPQHRDELLGVDRLGQIIPRPGLDTLLTIALHGLGGNRGDPDRPQ